MTDRPLTGFHVLAMFVAGFGIIIAVNLTMAFKAVGTFPGLETPNSYVASQSFDTRRAAQEALGWRVEAAYTDGVLRLQVFDRDGIALDPARFDAVIGRPTTRAEDQPVILDASSHAAMALAPGLWRLDIATTPGHDTFAQALTLRVAK